MKRILSQTIALSAFVAAGAMFTPACADNDGTIFVRFALAPPTNRQNNTCSYLADPAALQLFQGDLDVGLRDNYTATLLVGNQMIQRGDSTATRAETNRVHVDGAVVRVTTPAGQTLKEFTAATSGFIDAASSNIPGYGLAQITAIDGDTAVIIAKMIRDNGNRRQLVLANIKVFGKSVGGVDVESGEFSFPIRTCYGCLVDFEGYDDPATPAVDCNLEASSAMSATTMQAPCQSGQDERVSCISCKGSRPACNGQL